MKKVFFIRAAIVCLFFAVCTSLSAQDIILTMDSDIIEANVTEITDDVVIYKDFDNPDGPIYRISTAKIVKIKFKNGKEQVFGRQLVKLPSGPVSGSSAVFASPIEYKKGSFYSNDIKLTSADLETLLPIDLYKQAKGGMNMRKHGKRLLIAGSVLSAVGIAATVAGSVLIGSGPNRYGEYSTEQVAGAYVYISGAVALGTGGTCLTLGVPFYCVGQHRAKKAATSYNSSKTYPDLTLNVGSTSNGLGLYLNF